MVLMKKNPRKGVDELHLRRLPSEWPMTAQYALALVVVVLSLAVRWLLGEVLHAGFPFALTLGVLLPLVLLVRTGPFVAGALVGWAGAFYLFVPPPLSFSVAKEQEVVMVALLTLVLSLTGVTAWVSRRTFDGRVRAAMALRDSTERENRLADETEEAEVKFRAVFNQTGIFGGIADLDGTVREANDVSLRTCGYRAEEVIGRPLAEGPWWRGSEEAKAEIREATARAARGEISRATLPFWWADGTERVMEMVILPLRDEAGEVVFLHPTGIDITERQLAEKELRYRSEQFETLLNAAPIGAYLVDADFRILQVNPIALETFGKVSGGVIGRDFGEIAHIVWPPPLADGMTQILRRTRETGESYHAAEVEQTRLDRGVTGYYKLRVDRITLSDGNYGVVAYYRDISEQVRARAASAASEERYRTLFESIDEGFCIIEMLFDPDGRPVDYRFTETNPSFLKHTGIRDAIGKTICELVPGFGGPWFDIYGNVALTGEPKRLVEYADAMGRWFDLYAFRVGAPREFKVAILFTDITEQKKGEDALAELTAEANQQRRFYDTILSSTPDLVYVFDRNYHFRYANQALLQMWGRSEEDSIGKGLLELGYEPWHAEMHEREIDQVIATKKPVRGEVPFPHATLGKRIYDYIFVPVINETGEVESIAGTTRDITDRKAAELALAQAQEELQKHAENLEKTVAERTARLRETVAELEHFSYTITHDMRAPLRAMQAFSQILSDDYRNQLDEQGADYLRRIIESANRMDGLITDSLNYAKAIQRELVLGPVDPGALLRGMVESYPQFQEPRGKVEVMGDFPSVVANQAGLTQCFSNLLDNAIKFVEPGELPRVRVWAEEQGDRVRLWIEDNGIGIPADQRDRVFTMFQRLSRDVEGTGVGLALVRKVVERMRGKVGLESAPDGGSLFWVDLQKAS